MQPFMTEENFNEGQKICSDTIKSLQKTDPRSAVAGLAMALVVASDVIDTPLESIFQFMREIRRGFAAMQKDLDDKRARGELPPADSKIILP